MLWETFAFSKSAINRSRGYWTLRETLSQNKRRAMFCVTTIPRINNTRLVRSRSSPKRRFFLFRLKFFPTDAVSSHQSSGLILLRAWRTTLMKNGVSSVQFIICRATKYDFARFGRACFSVSIFMKVHACRQSATAEIVFSPLVGGNCYLRKRRPRTPSFPVSSPDSITLIDRFLAVDISRRDGIRRSRQARSRGFFTRDPLFSSHSKR